VLDQGSDMPVVLSLREAEAEDHLIWGVQDQSGYHSKIPISKIKSHIG
jgi:hypothetical protein